MTHFKHSFSGTTIGTFTLACVLSACSSTADRERPPRDEARQERPDRGSRQSGTFAQPAALIFTEMDRDADRIVEKAELTFALPALWAEVSSSGSVGPIAYARWSERALGSTDSQPTMMTLDRDFSGSLTQAEFVEGFTGAFDRLDKNKDNRLTRTEMILSFAAPVGRVRSGDAGQGKRGGQRGGRGGDAGGGGRGG